jgi:N-acetylglutamate synthase-like GNAT family acetyltransferase
LKTLLTPPKAALGPATLHDVPAMADLINHYAALGRMLPRDVADLYRSFREYVVVTGVEGQVLACGGIRVYNPELAEICGLAVSEEARGSGYGGAIVEALIQEAKTIGIRRTFVMTLEEDFFKRMGFTPIPRFNLPEKMESDCRGCSRRVGCQEIAMIRTIVHD